MNDIDVFRKVKLLALDFDGVMTDGTVYVDQNGTETVRCSRKDGLGINLLHRYGIEVHVISKETNPVVSTRCKKLGIPYDQAVDRSEGKVEILKRIMEKLGLTQEEIAFMGDDLNDIPALRFAGVSITVADGHPRVKEIVHYITKAVGGNHAVREVAELILQARGIQLNQF